MPSIFGNSGSGGWIRTILNPFRVLAVFLLSGLASFCAFQDGGALLGANGHSSPARGAGRERIALWDADLMPDGAPMRARTGTLRGFADSVDPDVLVLYDVPTFAALLKLRDDLGLYGYTAVMSNFFCDTPADGPRWPIELAILSRYPIDQAIEFDPPTGQSDGCTQRGPFTDGPVVASHQTLVVPAGYGLHWPDLPGAATKRPLPGPGFLVARIDSARSVIVGVHVPLPTEYFHADARAINDMRQAVTASLAEWIWRERNMREDDHFLAAGDFGVDSGVGPRNGELPAGNADNNFDGADTILTQGVIGGGSQARPRSDYTLGGLRMTNLTRALVVQTVGTAQAQHSGRIYLWSHRPGVFGIAQRVQTAYGSRSYPLVVASSGGTCAIDPLLTWMRRGATFAGLSKQVFTAAGTALEDQLAARQASKTAAPWVISLDLDDMLIDNSPFLYDMANKCQLPSVADWDKWVSSGRAKLLPGAATFLAKARVLAAGGHGRILIFTKRRPDQAAQTVELLKKLKVMTGSDDPLVQLEYAATPKSRELAWKRATEGGKRIVLVVGNSTDQFPDDAGLPIGGTAASCANPPNAAEDRNRLFGEQTPRFGICYFLIPVHVL